MTEHGTKVRMLEKYFLFLVALNGPKYPPFKISIRRSTLSKDEILTENLTLWENPLKLKINYIMKNSPKYDRESIQLLKLNICY